MLLNYTKHINPASHKDILSKIHSFASAQSWNIIDYRTSCEWSTGWVSGSEDYLDVLSYGANGKQHLHYRFRAEAAGSDPDAEWVWLGAVFPKTTTDEVIGTGNGTATNFTGNFSDTPIVKHDTGTTTISYTIGGTVYAGTDDGAGAITGTNISSGTINYLTGAYDITFSTAPDNATDITATYKNTAINTASSTHPVEQNNIMQPNKFSLAPYTIPACWIFGDGNHLILIAHINNEIAVSFHLGSVELYNPDEIEGNFFAMHNLRRLSYHWYEHSDAYRGVASPWNLPYGDTNYGNPAKILYAGAIVNNKDNLACNTRVQLDALSNYFSGYKDGLNRNNFTGKRVLLKPIIYLKQASGNWIPLGTFPMYWIEYMGLTPGQELDYGSEKYIAFPESLLSRTYGFAFRVA